MDYKDLQNIANLSQEILTESLTEDHNPMNRWPYTSPYLQESVEDIEEARDGYGDDSKFNKPDDKIKRPGTDVPPVKKYGRISRFTPYGIGAHAHRTASRVTTIVGDDPGAPRSEKMAKKEKEGKKESSAKKMVKKGGKWVKEGYDVYDLILSHLLDEGFADTPEAANAIMTNMSEAWVDSIVDLYIEG